MSAMLVKGAAVLGDVVDKVCRKGGSCRKGRKDPDGEYTMILNLNGRTSVVFTDDVARIVGPTVVHNIETALGVKLSD